MTVKEQFLAKIEENKELIEWVKANYPDEDEIVYMFSRKKTIEDLEDEIKSLENILKITNNE